MRRSPQRSTSPPAGLTPNRTRVLRRVQTRAASAEQPCGARRILPAARRAERLRVLAKAGGAPLTGPCRADRDRSPLALSGWLTCRLKLTPGSWRGPAAEPPRAARRSASRLLPQVASAQLSGRSVSRTETLVRPRRDVETRRSVLPTFLLCGRSRYILRPQSDWSTLPSDAAKAAPSADDTRPTRVVPFSAML
jgi:hypothetical protein